MQHPAETHASSDWDSEGTVTEKSLLFRVALAAYIIMIAGTLLYPDTFTRTGLRVGPFRISALAVLFAIAAPPVFAYIWNRRAAMKPGFLDAALIMTVGYMAIRGIAAATNGNEIALDVAFAGYIMLAYYGAVVLGKGDSAARTIIHAIAILTVVISAYAIIEFLFNNNMIYGALTEEKVPIRSEEFHRSGSTLAQPVALGIYLVMTIPLLVYSFVMSGNFSRRVFWGVAIVAALAALLVSFSKGSWLTAIIIGFMAFVYLLVERRKFKGILRPVITLIASSLLIFTLIVSISYRNVAFNVFSPERRLESFGFRKHMWEKVPGEFGEHVLIGVGMWQGDDDLYRIAYAEEASEGLEYGEGLIPIDNLYLTVLLEGGLVGISLLAVTLFLIGRQALTIIRSGGTRATFTIPLAAGMVALLINGATADTLMVWPVMVVFWLYAGLIRARAEDGQDNR